MTHDEAFADWRERRASGEALNAIDLYELVAKPRGLRPEELPLEERLELRRLALPETWPGFALLPEAERGREPIEIVPYDDRWPAIFEQWKERLLNVLRERPRIEHVGSTSVPGLAAKPIVDIQVSVKDMEDESTYVPQVESLGVRLRSRDDYHRYFLPLAGRPREVHIHVCASRSEWERRHLLFVAYLRHEPWARDSYLAAKHAAAARWRDDRWAYTDAKNDAVAAIMARAEAWALDTAWSP
ncbi:MAG TPA: GrpB family protein [Candidatus Dormibacteraeota bacterium]|nr:GrpB family protein [Candidatus Dormibacteraeota bacterium]HEX2680889.1 GrpB family protein [Candidatus Dormibacteraeota bacterium]